MVNRYYGNTGRVERVEEPTPLRRAPARGPAPPPRPKAAPRRPTPEQRPAPALSGIFDGIGGFISRAARGLETEDMILLGLLYLLYRESRDEEWLIIMGAMLFL